MASLGCVLAGSDDDASEKVGAGAGRRAAGSDGTSRCSTGGVASRESASNVSLWRVDGFGDLRRSLGKHACATAAGRASHRRAGSRKSLVSTEITRRVV